MTSLQNTFAPAYVEAIDTTQNHVYAIDECFLSDFDYPAIMSNRKSLLFFA